MPRISEFFGIVIYMYWFDTKRHCKPHFHAIFNGRQAVYGLDGSLLAGRIGRRAHKLIIEFILERRFELQSAWKSALKGEEIPWIKPIL